MIYISLLDKITKIPTYTILDNDKKFQYTIRIIPIRHEKKLFTFETVLVECFVEPTHYLYWDDLSPARILRANKEIKNAKRKMSKNLIARLLMKSEIELGW